MSTKTQVVIVGSGIFGTSTALWLQKKGTYDVTILDKSDELPAPDAASTDLNKIIRSGDYADPAIAALSVDSVVEWRKPEWEGTYHESGVLMVAESSTAGVDYVKSSYTHTQTMKCPTSYLPDAAGIISAFPKSLGSANKLNKFTNVEGYINRGAGWAEAGRAVAVGLKRVEAQGGVVRAGCEVVGLEEYTPEGETKKKVTGVRLEGGEVVKAGLVVLAAGAWTPALFSQADMGKMPSVVATGQSVAKIQLTSEEAKEYADVPVIFNMNSGVYVFPPNPDNIVKIALHGAGYLNTSNPVDPKSTNEEHSQQKGVSVPRTILTPGAQNGMIPKEMVEQLREGLRLVYPKLAELDFSGTRLCWYTDTVDGDWVVDFHPERSNVVLATAGCGHAFKFFTNIGREVVNKIEGTLDPVLAHKWRFEGRDEAQRDASQDSDIRPELKPKPLKLDELATFSDLRAVSVSA